MNRVVFEGLTMKKFLSAAIAIILLAGCFESEGLVGNEYSMVYESEQLFPISIGFRKNQTFYANTVNNIDGIYNLNGSSLTMQITDKTQVVPNINFVEIENRFLHAIPKVSSYQLTNDGLQLITYDKQILNFRRIGNAD